MRSNHLLKKAQAYLKNFVLIFQPGVLEAMEIVRRRYFLPTHIVHTPKDNPEIVDCNKLVAIAAVLRSLLVEIK